MIRNKFKTLAMGFGALFFGGLFCSLVFIVDDNYYYNPWNASMDSNHCMAVYTNLDSIADASKTVEMTIASSVITKTAKYYSDTACATLDATIVATSNFVTGAYLDTKIIYNEAGDYKIWNNEPVSALTMDISYSSATLTCNTDSCVTNYSGLIALNNCSSGSLAVNTAYDYTACEFSGQPATLYTLAYRNSFKELIFGTSHVLSTDSGDLAGDTAANRHKYLYANERYSLQ